MKPDPRLLDPSVYPFVTAVQTRYADLDLQGHLNNVRLTEIYQEARILMLRDLVRQLDAPREKHLRTLVAQLSVHFLREIPLRPEVEARCGIAHLGRSSLTVIVALFDAGQCCGLCSCVLVNAGPEGPSALTTEWRELLERHRLPDGLSL